MLRSLLSRCLGGWQSHIFLRTTTIRMEIFTLKSPATSLSTILVLEIPISAFAPTFVRLPGYPLFIAGVYALFGHGNDEALFIVQGVLDTLTCVLIAMLAWLWYPGRAESSRRAGGLPLGRCMSFTTIYSAVMLTETLTMFLSVAMVVAATLHSSDPSPKVAPCGGQLALAGAVQLFRPDAGLFAAGYWPYDDRYAFIRFRAGEGNVRVTSKQCCGREGFFLGFPGGAFALGYPECMCLPRL